MRGGPGPFILATASALFGAATAHAAPGAASGKAVIVAPLSVVASGNLDFGSLVSGPTTGTVTINPTTGARTTTGGVTGTGAAFQPATFVAAGIINRLMVIAIPGSPITLTNGTGGSMTVSNWQLDGPTIRLMPGTGVATLRVGGRLNVGANQAAGDYSGSYSITVVYL